MKDTVLIAIPIYNEEKYIISFLNSVLRFKIPNNVEVSVFLIDGMSNDGTRSLINNFIKDHKNFKLVDNPDRYQSQALNIIIKKYESDYIMRLDAHTIYPENYLMNCYSVSKKINAENVGGVLLTMQSLDRYESALVQALTTHSFGVGNSFFRTKNQFSKEVDTVPFGFFKTKVFKQIGLFDERLIRCQDYEFNRRIKLNGGKIWIDSNIISSYYNKPTLKQFYSKQFFKDAPYNPYMWYLAPYTFELRHAITGLFFSGLLIGGVLSYFFDFIMYIYVAVVLLYMILSILSSIQQSIRYRKILHVLILPFCFFTYHFIHGFGVIIGVIKLLFGIAPVQKNSLSKGF